MTIKDPQGSIDLGSEIARQLTVHKNVNQEIIVTTSDKLKLVLIETKASLTAKRDWITPFGLTASFIATLCTADFKPALGQTPEFWRATFVLLTIGSGAWLAFALWRLFSNWQSDDIEKVIGRIKPKTETPETVPASEGPTVESRSTLVTGRILRDRGYPPKVRGVRE